MTTLTANLPAAVPATPVAATHVATRTSIVWNWNTVPDATGYRWSTIDDFGTATDMGTVTTQSETALNCGTAYTRFVWAYNFCGYSTPVVLTQSSTVCCSATISINHIAGVVAPVTKTVTYGIVDNIPGEPSKCWIISNLGSDHQATAVDDTTEASAGWYWQFNRKQGYKLDGTTITPNTWISYINENSGWTMANDPCNIELGSLWRIPTYTEWYNVDNTGDWTDWTGPWNSGLKLHAAGYMSSGSLHNRGSEGGFWSSHGENEFGYFIYLHMFNSSMYPMEKWWGYSLRCLRE